MCQNQTELTILIKKVSDRIRASADCEMREREVTFSQGRVLHYLDGHGGTASQKMLEEHLGVAHPTVVGLVSRLEKNGFLTCQMDERDKRNKVITTTAKAAAVREKIESERKAAERILTQGLSEEEVSELRRLLLKVYENVENNANNREK